MLMVRAASHERCAHPHTITLTALFARRIQARAVVSAMAACARDDTATLRIGCRCLYRLALFNEADGDGVRAVAGAHGAEAVCKAMAMHVDGMRHVDAAELLEEGCRALASLAFGSDAGCDTVRHTGDSPPATDRPSGHTLDWRLIYYCGCT